MSQAIQIERYGGVDVLSYEALDIDPPAGHEIRMKHHAIGLNYIDVYVRTGLYPHPLPLVPGMEGAGEITALGAEVEGLQIGDRIAYAGPIGAYAEERNIAAEKVVKIPDSLSFQNAASIMLKGMTAHYLLRKTYRVASDTKLLIHAAAGGVGLIVCQWASALGAEVIGTVGSEEKAALAKAHGCTHVIPYRQEDFVKRVHDITDGRGVDVVYDSIGKATYPHSLDCLLPRGLWVSFGQASGALPEINLAILAQKGSLFATRPSLFTYIESRTELTEAADDLFRQISDGTVKVTLNQTYPLERAQQAHEDLEARKTTGSSLLIP